MYELGADLKIGKTTYTLVLNTKALADIQKMYGSVDSVAQRLTYDDEDADQTTSVLEVLADVVAVLANEGSALREEEGEPHTDPITTAQVLRRLMPKDIGKTTTAVMEALRLGLVDPDAKKPDENAVVDEVLQEIEAEKNA